MNRSTAFVLIDCQEDFLARPGLVPDRDTLVAQIAVALRSARAQGMRVAHVRTSSGSNGTKAMPHRRAAPEVVEGTPGAAAPVELAEATDEPVFAKHFFSALDAEEFAQWLAAESVDRIHLAGVHTHACIQATALDAYARGYRVLIDPCLVGSDRPEHARQALAWLDGRAARVDSLESPDLSGLNRQQAALAALSVADRHDRLGAWLALLEQRAPSIVDALVSSVSKPRRDAEGEVAYGLSLVRAVTESLSDHETFADRLVRYRPIGTVALITPWNNPFAIPVGKIAPAIGYGNAVAWKPAPAGTAIADLVLEGLVEAGLGAFVSLFRGGAPVGAALAEADGIAALSFTGSVTAGRSLMATAGRRALPIQAELGGSNAAIVDRSADLALAAKDLAAAIFSFAGQRCTAIRRIIVHKHVSEAFESALVEAVTELRLGDPDDPRTDVGPMIDPRARAQLAASIDDATAKGARAIVGGTEPVEGAESDRWLRPTVLTDVPTDHPLRRREAFGPVAILIVADDLDAALALHNDSAYGLVGAIYANDADVISAFARQAEAAILSLNRARPPFSSDGPFTGWKASGFGIAEHGRWNRDFYTRAQVIY